MRFSGKLFQQQLSSYDLHLLQLQEVQIVRAQLLFQVQGFGAPRGASRLLRLVQQLFPDGWGV